MSWLDKHYLSSFTPQIKMTTKSSHISDLEFCSNCGSVLTFPKLVTYSSELTCNTCSHKISIKQFDGLSSTTRIEFNSKELAKKEYQKSKNANNKEQAIGPVVDRKCWKCGHDKMSYATLQTRSADEGQTVFYTCVKCGGQDNENS